jgi:hypothetical protein
VRVLKGTTEQIMEELCKYVKTLSEREKYEIRREMRKSLGKTSRVWVN